MKGSVYICILWMMHVSSLGPGCVHWSLLWVESTVKHRYIRVRCAIQQHCSVYPSPKSGTSRGGECRVVAHRRGEGEQCRC